MGSKDLQKFNIAMLAKQGWRLLNEMNPLITKLMKARYFPNDDFLSVRIGDNPSYLWRSILVGQEVLRQGCRRSIGTGEDTLVWKVPWLPCTENGYVTTDMPPELENIKVSNLMTAPDRWWEDEVLADIFNDRDVRLINRIILSSLDRQDSWLWLFDGKGNFTVKSCYHRIVGECDTSDASFWKHVWALAVPEKVKVLLW